MICVYIGTRETNILVAGSWIYILHIGVQLMALQLALDTISHVAVVINSCCDCLYRSMHGIIFNFGEGRGGGKSVSDHSSWRSK